MNLEQLRAYCLSFKAATEDTPFGEDTLVFRVANKMFALTSITAIPTTVNLRAEPEQIIEDRETHPDHVQPGWHMNKKYWNTVQCQTGLSSEILKEMIANSYHSVVKTLKKSEQQALLDS